MKNHALPAIQADHSVRLVALSNLRAMASRASGTCHRYAIHNVTANRVVLSYSNPDEWGCECPVFAHFAAIPSGFAGYSDSVFVVLHVLRVTGGRDADDRDAASQAFDAVIDADKLWRDASGEWVTEYEALIARFPQFATRSEWDKDGCVQTWFASDGASFTNWRDAQAHAVTLARTHERAATRA